MKIIVIGGVAGGASFAARLRRLNEGAQITIFERGDYVSFANCGLPYHLSGAIPERDDLILKTPTDFKSAYNIEVKTGHEVISINKEKKTVQVKNHSNGNVTEEAYDKLLLSPGARAFIPRMEGYRADLVHTLKTIPDMDKIISHIERNKVSHAVVIGGGFIGLEVAENLAEKGIKTELVEFADQVMIAFDREMANILHNEITARGIRLHLESSVKSIEELPQNKLKLTLTNGKTIETGLLVSAVGVRPESDLALNAGLKLNEKGAIVVNENMQSSDPHIYAVGDAIEVVHLVDGTKTLLPLAGPAAKQARVAANHIMGLMSHEQRIQGTAIVKVFGLTAAVTGLNEKYLKRVGINYQSLYLHPFNHVGYYPGARQMTLKVLYSKNDGKLLGAQAVGANGVDKRIDVLATAIRAGMKATDLQDLELCYAPPYGSSKDAVNMAGFVADNIEKGLVRNISPSEMGQYPQAFILDVRTPEEFKCGNIPGSVNIPLSQIRSRLADIPKDKTIIVNCAVGIRAYNVIRILTGEGYKDLYNLSGGYKSYCNETQKCNDACCGDKLDELPHAKATSCCGAPVTNNDSAFDFELNLSGLQCPGPVLSLKKKLDEMSVGQRLKAKVSDPGFIKDIPAFCESTGNKLLGVKSDKDYFYAVVEKGMPKSINKTLETNKKTIVVFSGDLDKALATFIIANGARAMGSEVTLFFTFWGLNILRDPKKYSPGKALLDAMFGMMMPKGAGKLKLSKMNMLGMGTAMMKYVMNKKKVDSLESLMKNAVDSGIHLVACSMSMDVMGIKQEELIDGVEIGGVAHYLNNAEQSNLNLFI